MRVVNHFIKYHDIKDAVLGRCQRITDLSIKFDSKLTFVPALMAFQLLREDAGLC